MSTLSESPAGGAGTAVGDPHEHHWFREPTKPVTPLFITALVFAQFVFFVALLGPAIIGIGIKVQSIVPEAERNAAIGLTYGIGALCALLGNVIFGRISDRTTSRWGRRRPWLIIGTLVMTAALAIVASASSVTMVTVGWGLAQFGANAAYAPYIATISDQVPKAQRAAVSALVGIALNVGVLGGVFVAEKFQHQMMIMFVGPSLLAIGAMLLFAFVLPDQVLPTKPPKLSLSELASTFVVNPVKYPDFAFAWLSRFLITLAGFMFTTFRLFFVQDELNVPKDSAAGVVSTGVLIYTIALVAAGWVAGKISDKTGKRKFLVAGSTALFAIGTVLLVHVNSLTGFYGVEAILGAAFGIYMGVDLALVIDVLPNPDDAGKDLGVFNMANALPQSLAPVLGAALLGVGVAAGAQNYSLLLYVAATAGLIGALVIIPIKKVK